MGACDDGIPVAVGDGHGEFRSQETVRLGTHVLEVTQSARKPPLDTTRQPRDWSLTVNKNSELKRELPTVRPET
jgi:hypothetical protein